MDKCLICGSEAAALFKVGLYGDSVFQCQGCGLVLTWPRPIQEELVGKYGEEYYSHWISPVQSARRERLWARRLKVLKRLCGTGRLLDVGCGEGTFLRMAAEAGYKVSGLEFSAYAAAYARDNFGLDVRNVGIENTDFPDGFFDIVTMWHVLEHLSSPLAALEKIKKLLKPTGRLLVAVPNINDKLGQEFYRFIKGSYFQIYSRDSKEPHLWHFSSDTLRKLLEKVGFRIEKLTADMAQVDPYWRIIEWISFVTSKFTCSNMYLALLAVGRK